MFWTACNLIYKEFKSLVTPIFFYDCCLLVWFSLLLNLNITSFIYHNLSFNYVDHFGNLILCNFAIFETKRFPMWKFTFVAAWKTMKVRFLCLLWGIYLFVLASLLWKLFSFYRCKYWLQNYIWLRHAKDILFVVSTLLISTSLYGNMWLYLMSIMTQLFWVCFSINFLKLYFTIISG